MPTFFVLQNVVTEETHILVMHMSLGEMFSNWASAFSQSDPAICLKLSKCASPPVAIWPFSVEYPEERDTFFLSRSSSLSGNSLNVNYTEVVPFHSE